MLIYIHGFNSSALSFKAGLVRERMLALGRGAEFACPELDHRPRRAIAQLEALIAEAGKAPVTLIGSSLGGYYATYQQIVVEGGDHGCSGFPDHLDSILRFCES